MAAVLVLVATSCNKNGEKVKFNRFEKLLFETDASALQQKLMDSRSTYASPLINCEPESQQYMMQLQAFVSDPFMKEIYRLTDSCYDDLRWLERDLASAMGRARKLSDNVVPKRYFTMITGEA